MANAAKPLKDTEYLYASGRIKSLEANLLSRDKLERMCDAKVLEDALKLLDEAGWPEIAGSGMAAVEEVLARRRTEAFALVRTITPDKRLADFFEIKYDYHNVKTMLKSEATGDNDEALLIDNGRIACRQLRTALLENRFSGMSGVMTAAIAEARDTLARTQDPQLLDMILDRAMYGEMTELAEAFASPFLKRYVVLLIDSQNLRAAVRLRRMGKGLETLRYALVPGGEVPVSRLMAETTPDVVEIVFALSPLVGAAAVGARALRGEESLAAVDLACDDALLNFLKSAKYVPFGPEPLIGYLAAVETELASVRTVIAGRLAGISAEMITERLRETYV